MTKSRLVSTTRRSVGGECSEVEGRVVACSASSSMDSEVLCTVVVRMSDIGVNDDFGEWICNTARCVVFCVGDEVITAEVSSSSSTLQRLQK